MPLVTADNARLRILGERLAPVVALLYVALLPLNVSLWRGQIFLHDLLAPLMGVSVLLLLRTSVLGVRRHLYLVAFLAAAGLATVCHFRGGTDIREFAIFGYMVVLFLFFRTVKLDSRILFYVGCITMTAFCLYAVGQKILGTSDVYEAYETASLSFIAKRFFFTFNHPNLTGSFYVLPVIMFLCCFIENKDGYNDKRLIVFLVILFVLCIPLAMTVSKHMIVSIAVASSIMVKRGIPFGRMATTFLVLLSLIMFFIILYATVLVPFFPLTGDFPFLNTSTFGMYTIHQVAYLKMVFSDPSAFLMGRGRLGVIQAYPLFVDPAAAQAILVQYKSGWLLDRFTTYMDAHNEYLNLAATFGVPTMVLCYTFWARCARRAWRSQIWRLPVLFFVVSIFMASLWDDLLSKRWIWVSLGILMQRADPLPVPRDEGEPDGS